MANYTQLSFLTSDQRTDFDAGLGLIHAEVVKVSWPSPTGVIFYAWENFLADSVYNTPLTTFLDGAPLVVAFAASSRTNRFHEIPRTLSIGDDTVSMTFSNVNRTIETLIHTHGSGVKVEFFDFYPNVDGGYAWPVFLGKLQTPQGHGAINKDWITLTAVSGLASSNITIPNFAYPQQCSVRYGGQMTAAELPGHPCSMNRHLTTPEQAALGGAKGLLNGDGSPFPTCPHTEDGCVERFGHKLVYMGTKTVTTTVPVGAGEHKTYSTTHGRYGSLLEPVSIVFGERDVTATLVDYRKEVNPGGPDVAGDGTLVTLFVPALGPVEEVTNVELMERTPQGLDIRLGTQEQTPTVFTIDPPPPSLNRRVVINANHNPIDPSTVQVEQLKLTCHMKGRNTVRVYSDQDTWTESYTNNRAWALLELIENTWYGLRLDRARLLVSDFIYLAGKDVSFNCQVTARSAQQQLADIVESGRWYPPIYNNGLWRWLPIEELDLEDDDIPVFTDTGASRNILRVESNGYSLSTVSPSYIDPGELANDVYLQFDDEDHKNITRPLHFPDWTAQARAGAVYGDNTKRPITKTYTAYGITALSEAVPLGAFYRDLGRYWLAGECGLANNLEVTFTTAPERFADVIELHPGKCIKIVSENLDTAIYTDTNDDPFEFFIIKKLERTSESLVIVTAQAYGVSYYTGLCSAQSGYVTWPSGASVISGPHGTDTRIQAAGTPPLTISSVTWPGSISAGDVVTDRIIHTVDALPSSGGAGVYNITYPVGPIGFKVWYNGLVWIYHTTGIDFTTLPAGAVAAGDTLGMDFDRNGGSPLRRYKHNGVTVYTDTGGSVAALNGIAGEVASVLGDVIGDVFWEVYPCTPTDVQDPGTSGGTTTTSTSSGDLIGEGLIGEGIAG